MNVVLQSKRLLFRQFTEEDGGLICELNRDPEVIRYVHEPATTSENAAGIIREIILPQYKLELGRWAVHLKYTSEFIGWCGLKNCGDTGEIDLGFRFKKEYWGNGYATEAAQTCIGYGFNHMNIRDIIARAHVGNLASLRVLEKCGMSFLRQEVVDEIPVKTYHLLNPLL